MRTKGKITSWNDAKGFGFITPLSGGKPVFIHIKAFGNPARRPEVGQVVSYALSTDGQGRPRAVNATMAGDRLVQHQPRHRGVLPVIGATLFLVIVAAFVLASKVPPLVFVVYLVASLLAFVFYAIDKSAAKSGAWRTPESTLHLLSLAGGWPGALVAQQVLRHKTKKASFRSVFRVTVFLNCAVFVWISTATGAAMLRSFMSGMA